jgi:hypothetical protein
MWRREWGNKKIERKNKLSDTHQNSDFYIYGIVKKISRQDDSNYTLKHPKTKL